MTPPPHIILVGLPGSGKSTVGPLLATALKAPFIDLDLEIERRERMTIGEIFASRGEQEFRSMERTITQELAARPSMVIAPGGGWMTHNDNVALLRPPARIVHLQVTPDAALKRLGASIQSRPLLAGPGSDKRLAQLAEERRALYAKADEVVDTVGKTPEQVADWCLSLARRWGWPVDAL